MRRALATLLTCAAVLVCGAFAPAQQTTEFSGRVIDTNRNGIANLEIKLTPPTSANLPIRLGTTDRNGGFVFRQLARSRYLIEVSQGVYLLYRAEIDAARQSRVEITLRTRG